MKTVVRLKSAKLDHSSPRPFSSSGQSILDARNNEEAREIEALRSSLFGPLPNLTQPSLSSNFNHVVEGSSPTGTSYIASPADRSEVIVAEQSVPGKEHAVASGFVEMEDLIDFSDTHILDMGNLGMFVD